MPYCRELSMYVSYVEIDKSYRLNGSNLKKEQLRSIKLIILFINYLICSHIKKIIEAIVSIILPILNLIENHWNQINHAKE